MKQKPRILQFLFLAILLSANNPSHAQLFKKLKDKVNQALDRKTDNVVDNTVNNALDKNNNNTNTSSPNSSGSGSGIKAFKNYDFVPGDKIIFEDHLDTDEEGEFPSHWHLIQGQSTMNTYSNHKSILLTGRDTRIIPAIKTKSYLTDSFTVEFDTYSKEDFRPVIRFYSSEDAVHGDDTELASIILNDRFGNLRIVPKNSKNATVVPYPPALSSTNYPNAWHHVAIAYKNNRLKVYVDSYRIVSIPDFEMKPMAISVQGDGKPEMPVIISDFKLAQGAGIKTQETKFTDAKIVTHGINFDINKADIKPESMGTLNAIAAILKSNPELKFEIQGHTDNTGNPASNLTLSQKRADEVMKQLISLGIDATRLSSKGFGDTKPISPNTSPEGKANNRRVEFVRI